MVTHEPLCLFQDAQPGSSFVNIKVEQLERDVGEPRPECQENKLCKQHDEYEVRLMAKCKI